MPKRQVQHILSAAVSEELALSVRLLSRQAGTSVSASLREALLLWLRERG